MRAVLAPAVGLLFVVLGCSANEEKVVTHPVSGRILYDGQPAAGVRVTLMPTDAPMVPRIPRNPRGVTGADGRFTISTFTDGDGAAEGGYQVVLFWPQSRPAEDEQLEEQETDRLLGWYDPAHSTLNVRIRPGSNELPTWNLPKRTQPPPASEGIPGRN